MNRSRRHWHWLLMPASLNLDDAVSLLRFHSPIHSCTFACDPRALESIVRDHRGYAHANTTRNHWHERRSGIHRIRETGEKERETTCGIERFMTPCVNSRIISSNLLVNIDSIFLCLLEILFPTEQQPFTRFLCRLVNHHPVCILYLNQRLFDRERTTAA